MDATRPFHGTGTAIIFRRRRGRGRPGRGRRRKRRGVVTDMQRQQPARSARPGISHPATRAPPARPDTPILF